VVVLISCGTATSCSRAPPPSPTWPYAMALA